MPMNIAIDGPVGAGKSSIADQVAQRLHILHLDTGAMYRTVALYMLRNGIDPQDEQTVSARCGEADVRVAYRDGAQRTMLGGEDVSDLIRTGAAKAFVSAEFDGVDASLPVLAALGVEPEDGVLLLQRDIYADGKNICRANGRPITVAQLRALGTSLLNIHGQHEGTQLLDEEQHGAYLDRFARLDGLPEAYTERYQAARETRRQIEALEMDLSLIHI